MVNKKRTCDVRRPVTVASMTKKITEKILKWHGQVKKRITRGMKNGRCTSTRKDTERKAEYLLERLV